MTTPRRSEEAHADAAHAAERPRTTDAVGRDPLATPLTRRDLLEVLEEMDDPLDEDDPLFDLVRALVARLRLRWTWPEPEGSVTPRKTND